VYGVTSDAAADTAHDVTGDPAGSRPTITVDIYSDVVCPWCYIGKRKFELGLAEVTDDPADDLGADVVVRYHAFQLDPTAPPGVATPVIDAYSKKFGGPERAARIIDHVTATAAATGLDFRMERAVRANTLLAHRLIWLAGAPDSPVPQAAMKERLLKAYFTDGLNIGDPDVLADCAAEIGYERDEIVDFLAGEGGTAEVAAELHDAYENGITAVPTYVLDGRWAVPGAQEPETFAQVLRRMADRAVKAFPGHAGRS
jgi:predicted DsbA family dithiol-disulfide isomerase